MSLSSKKTSEFKIDKAVDLEEWKKRNRSSSTIAWSRWIPLITLVIVTVGFALGHEQFLSERNLTNLFRQVSVNCVLAFGMTLVILIGGIDLSVGSVLALCAVVAGLAQRDLGLAEMGVLGSILTVALMMGVGAMTGSSIGAMVSKLKMPAFVASLGFFAIARGLAHIFSESNQITGLSTSFRFLGEASLSTAASFILILGIGLSLLGIFVRPIFKQGLNWSFWVKALSTVLVTAAALWIFTSQDGLPFSVLMTGLLFLALYILLRKSVWGRSLYALGGNPEAARLCGIPVERMIFTTYVLMGLCVGLAAWIETGRLATADPRGGALYELDAIAAVVIGGTSLRGGVGRIEGTLLGALLIGTLSNGMSLMNVESNYQNVIKGVIILGAVLIDLVSKNRSARS